MHGRWGMRAGGHVWQRDVHGGGVCMAGGMCGGHAWQGVCKAEGGCAWQEKGMAGGACMAGKTAIAVGGMHPTGMHSCFKLIFFHRKIGKKQTAE